MEVLMGKLSVWLMLFLIGIVSAQQSDIVEEGLPLPASYRDTTGGSVVPQQECPPISRTPSTHVIVENIRGSENDVQRGLMRLSG
jgi:hypothetical protein